MCVIVRETGNDTIADHVSCAPGSCFTSFIFKPDHPNLCGLVRFSITTRRPRGGLPSTRMVSICSVTHAHTCDSFLAHNDPIRIYSSKSSFFFSTFLFCPSLHPPCIQELMEKAVYLYVIITPSLKTNYEHTCPAENTCTTRVLQVIVPHGC